MVKMLFFDLKESEKKFFEENDLSDFEISFYKECLDENTKLTLSDFDETSIISVFTKSRINKAVLDKFKNLRLISVRSAEFDNIDIAACRKRNIGVIKINDCNDNSTAQYVLGMILLLSRKVFKSMNDFANKQNRYDEYEGRDITKLSLGVIGTDSEGYSVCKLAHNLGMKIFAYDIKVNPEISEFADYLPLIDLLRQSDIITIHLPYNKDLYHFLSDSEFEIMKDSAFLINTSHAEFVDTKALYNAIKNKKLGGAALDIIECENMYYELQNTAFSEKNCAETLLLLNEMIKLENIIITPRIAHNTTDSVNSILFSSFHSIKDFYKGGHLNRIV